MIKWKFLGKEICTLAETPRDSIGFIYKITNLDNNKFYIGRKNLFSITNPVITKKKYEQLKDSGHEVVKTRQKVKSKSGVVDWKYKQKNVKKETNWESYTGSNKFLNKDIEDGANISREILQFCYTQKELTYEEVRYQFISEVLEDCQSYNSNILAKFFKDINLCP